VRRRVGEWACQPNRGWLFDYRLVIHLIQCSYDKYQIFFAFGIDSDYIIRIGRFDSETSPQPPATPLSRPFAMPSGEYKRLWASIDGFFHNLCPLIREYLAGTHVSHWTPPNGVTQETEEFYAKLQIPLIHGEPYLLLHTLGESPDPTALFSEKKR
jgi:hypothetical protein